MALNPNFGEAAYRAAARPVQRKPVAAKKPAVKPVVKAKPVSRPSGSVGQSAAQQLVNAALAPLLASIKSREASLASSQAGQRGALTGFTNEIMRYLQGTPTAMRNEYQQAVDTTDRLAQQSAAGLLAANPNEQNQALLASINAPQAQRDALAAQNQNVYGGGSAVLYKTGGAIPASVFAADGAGAAAYAESLPAIQGLSAQQLFAKLLADQGEDSQKLAAQRAEIEGKRPGLLQDANDSIAKQKRDELNYSLKLQSAGLAKDKFALSVQKMNNDLAYKTAGLSLSERRVAVTEANAANSTYFKEQALQLRREGNSRAAANFYKDAKGRTVPKGYRFTSKGLERISSSVTGAGGMSASQESQTVGRAQKAGEKAVTAVKDKIWNSAKAGAETEEEAQRNYNARVSKSFYSAMTRTIQAMGPHLKAMGYTPAQVKYAAYNVVSPVIPPPKGYRPPKAGAKKNGSNVSLVTPAKGIVTSKGWTATHITDGLDLNRGSKTAGDIMGDPGTPVGAPEGGTVVEWGSAQGGEALYFRGDSGRTYWLGHIDGRVPVGTRVGANEQIAVISADHARPHLHIDATGRASSSA